MLTGQELYRKAQKRIPGGTQLIAKRSERILPEQWPAYYSKAKGVEIWGLNGEKYIDMGWGGIGSCVLGFADPDVDNAVCTAIANGSMSTLNCPEEMELADLLCDLHPWADMVRYARCGGEAMAIAVRIARAKTGRETVAFCGYHGWHDWYLAANFGERDILSDWHMSTTGLIPTGVPRALQGTALPFHYNRIDELEAIVSSHWDRLAAIVMEPVRSHAPIPGFLEHVRDLANDVGAILIFDEVSSGFRLTTGGAHLIYNVHPDIAVFAKAISNGYPMAAIIGVGEVMEAARRTYISSTYWTERIGPTAALATIRKHQQNEVAQHLLRIGQLVRSGWYSAAERRKLSVIVSEIPSMLELSFDYPNGLAVLTLFTQTMLEKGFLVTGVFYPTYSHEDAHIQSYLTALDETFDFIARAIERGEVESNLKGPVIQPGFRRLT